MKTQLMSLALAGALMCGSVGSAYAEPQITTISDLGDIVEVRVEAETDFYIGALPHELKIGNQRFHLSRNPESGEANVLIFLVPKEAFNRIKNDDLVDLGYGRVKDNPAVQAAPSLQKQSTQSRSSDTKASSSHKRQWSLGRFNKAQ